MPTNINGNSGIDRIQDGSVHDIDIDSVSASKLVGNVALNNEYIMLTPNAHTTYAAGARITNMRVMQSYGNISQTSGVVSIARAGAYFVMCSLLCNTATSGSNGDGRIRYSTDNSSYADQAAYYSNGTDMATWEKSVGACVVPCAENSYIDFTMQSANHVWGSASGYSHTTFSIFRIGD